VNEPIATSLAKSSPGIDILPTAGTWVLPSFIYSITSSVGRLCGLVVSVADYKHRGPGFDSRALLRIFPRELGLEQGPLSLVIG
jgi:hypothetical protein